MRRYLPLALFVLLITTATTTRAQTDRFAYAVTDVTKEGMGWNALRKLDLQTGLWSAVLLNGTDARLPAYDALTKKQIIQQKEMAINTVSSTPFGTGVAAMAYDKRHNRLFYTPMFTDQLRYIDLTTMKLYYVTDQHFTQLDKHRQQGKIITRMVIAPDGNGYAVTSDANTFIKFTTGKKIRITQLGSLVDDPANKDISIHNKCSSYGGDMVADDDGNLYIVSAANHVFRVNTETRLTRHLGAIQQLPPGFSVNGMVVDGEGNLLVSSALNNSAYYVVDIKTLQAKPFEGMTDVFRSSDLANGNYLSSNKNTAEIRTIAAPQNTIDNSIRIHPNPVLTNRLNVQFNKLAGSDYTIELINIMGQRILQKKVAIISQNQTQEVPFAASSAKGFYLVKVYDLNKKSVFEQKIMVQ